MPGVGDRRHGGSPFASDIDPPLDQRLVGAGGDAQFGDLLIPGGVGPAFAETECGACALGQQVRPAAASVSSAIALASSSAVSRQPWACLAAAPAIWA